LLKNRVLKKIVGLEEKDVKRKEENLIMSTFVIFIPPKNPVTAMKLRKSGRGNAAGITQG